MASSKEIAIGFPAAPDEFFASTEKLIGRERVNEVSFTDSQEGILKKAKLTPEELFELLFLRATKFLDEADCEKLRKAFEFASQAHRGQVRKSGEPFVQHPIEVAGILADLHMDISTLCAALLHDTVEDTKVKLSDVERLFGEDVAYLVDGVTKISRIEVESLTDSQVATIRKMFVAMSKDIRVIVIKLADRLHNMRTLGALPEDRRIFKSRETLEIYAPIAHRLGISSMKWELEDLSFYYLEPNKFKQVARMVSESRAQREAYLDEVVSILNSEMQRLGIHANVAGRPKHLYSIYRKMVSGGKGFSEIYDLIAARVIVKTVSDCYSALGAVHTLWHPMPGRFKDYIAMPKFNMYQSLHTTVIGPAGRPLEVQIRTEEMHAQSEYGVAAHWRYKENNKAAADKFDQQLAWLRQMLDWQDDAQDSKEFLKDLKLDLAPNEVFVFTPKGEVMSLRGGSTPVDFAYAIHTEVGNHCVGAKVNGMIVPLSYELKMGDRVEVLTQKSASPSRNWLNYVKTPSARSKIRSYFSKMRRGDDLENGREKLSAEMRKHNIGISNTQSMRALRKVAESLGFHDVDEMMVHIGTGSESAQHVGNRLLKLLTDQGKEAEGVSSVIMGESAIGKMPPLLTGAKAPKLHEAHTSNGVVVKGVNDVLVRLSRCCNPVPGDKIIGFITRGRGVSVHRADCPNAKDLMRSPERIIEVDWEKSFAKDTAFKVAIHVEALDRTGLLLDVLTVISNMGANVLGSSSNLHRDGVVDMRFLFQVSDVASIDFILKRIRQIEGVFEAQRLVAKGNSALD